MPSIQRSSPPEKPKGAQQELTARSESDGGLGSICRVPWSIRKLLSLPFRFHYINLREYRVYAMKRAGQHAIIHWILKHTPGRTMFLNNVLLETHEGLYSGMPMIASQLDRLGMWSQKKLYVFSVEDADLRHDVRCIRRAHGPWFRGRSREVRELYVVRDPLNLFASRIKKYASEHMFDSESIELCRKYYRQYLGCRGYLGPDAIAINFNQWVCSRTYRKELGQILGLQGRFSEPYQTVHDYGGGSSFGELRAENSAEQMDLFQRWRRLGASSFLNAVARDPELSGMGEEIFAETHPEYKTWLEDARS